MSKANIEGFPWSGDHQVGALEKQISKKFATVQNINHGRVGMDAIVQGVTTRTAAAVVEAGSSTTSIKLTAHGIKYPGGIIRFTVGNLLGQEIGIKAITDVDNIELNGILPEDPTGMTFDLMEYVTPRFSSTGETLATITPSPLAFVRETGSGPTTTEVYEDTITPANTIPLPVKLVGINGDINLTANDINVQLSHNAANPDSTRIGNGTNEWGINASLEGLTHDTDLLALNTLMSAKLPAVLGQTLMANSLAVTIASDQSALNVIVDSSALPSGAATAALQTSGNASLTSLDGKDFAKDASLLLMSAKLPAALGQVSRATSISVTQSTEDLAVSASIKTAVETVAGSVSGTEMQVDLVGIGDILTNTTFNAEDFSSETTLAAMSAKLPAALGQLLKAASMSVTIASDDVLSVKDAPANGGSTGNSGTITSGTPVTFTKPANAIGFILACDETSLSSIRFRVGGVATASVGFPLLPTDKTPFIPCNSDVSVDCLSLTAEASIQWITRS